MLKYPTVQFLLAFVIVGLPAWSSVHAAIVLNGLTSDAHAIDNHPRDGVGDTTGDVDATTLRVGLAGSTGSTVSRSVVFVFQLPELGATESIAHATLSFTFISYQTSASVSSLGNVDLYGLDWRSSNAVLASDYYHGSLDPSDSATRLQDNLLAPSGLTTNQRISTSNEAGFDIAAYLNEQYASGAQAGDYVFFRFSVDEPVLPTGATVNARGYNIASADYGNIADRPALSLVVVPEPSRSAAILLACSFLIFRRRRKPPPCIRAAC